MWSFKGDKAFSWYSFHWRHLKEPLNWSSLGRIIQNSDLVNLLLAFDKERKEYSITMLSSVTYILSGVKASREETEVVDCRKAIHGTKWKRGLDQFIEMEKAARMTVSLCDQKRGKKHWGGRRMGRPPQLRSFSWACDPVSDQETCGRVLPANARGLERHCSLPHISVSNRGNSLSCDERVLSAFCLLYTQINSGKLRDSVTCWNCAV